MSADPFPDDAVPLLAAPAYHWTARAVGGLAWLLGHAAALAGVYLFFFADLPELDVPMTAMLVFGGLGAAWLPGAAVAAGRFHVYDDGLAWGYWFKDRVRWDDLGWIKVDAYQAEGITLLETSLWLTNGGRKTFRGGSTPYVELVGRLRADLPAGPPPKNRRPPREADEGGRYA